MSTTSPVHTLESLVTTVEMLAARLEALERENHALRQLNARRDDIAFEADAQRIVREPLTDTYDSSAPPGSLALDLVPSPLERLSRRWLLRRGMQVAAASVAAGVLLQHDTQSAAAQLYEEQVLVLLSGSGADISAIVASSSPSVSGTIKSENNGTGPALNTLSKGLNTPTIVSVNSGAGTAVYGEMTGDRPAIGGQNFGSGAGVAGENLGTGPAISGRALGSGGTGVKGTGPYGVWGESTASGLYGVIGKAANGTGVWGDASVFGVKGNGRTGVAGYSPVTGYSGVYGQHTGSAGYGVVGDGTGNGAGVVGRNAGSGPGVLGQQTGTAGVGVQGDGKGGSHAGVLGRNPAGFGVRGEGFYGVAGYSSTNGSEGIYGGHMGSATGWGVVGDGVGGTYAGVLGRNPENIGVHGIGVTGVRGEGTTGVQGKATGSTGYGGQFEGGKAQLRLVPRTTAGKPTTGSHAKGEIVLDSSGTLFICTIGGTPGTWRKVSTVLV